MLSAHKNLAAVDSFKKLPRIGTDGAEFIKMRMLQIISPEVLELSDLYRAGDILIDGKPPLHYPEMIDAIVVAVGAQWEVYRKREVGGGFLGIVADPNTKPEDADAISVGLIYLTSNIGKLLVPCRGVHLRAFAKVCRYLMDHDDEYRCRVKAEKLYSGRLDGSGQTIYFFDVIPS